MASGPSQDQVIVHLLPEFSCLRGADELPLSAAGRGLAVRLALEDGPLHRRSVATDLWPDLESGRAARRLSQLLWRIRDATGDALVEVDGDRIAMAADAAVDYRAARKIASNMLNAAPESLRDVDPMVVRLLGTELLRTAAEDHVLVERDRWDRLRQAALERAAAAGLEAGRAHEAIELSLVAAGIDELAETPVRIIFSSYIALGDTVAARRVYLEYEAAVRRALGVEPSRMFRDLVRTGTRPDRQEGVSAAPLRPVRTP
ncbi:BTAD domain-containing putative transcriptional regulator [Actinomadura sp. 9N215]|uniref:AfsR/SARP family transcriptional regulator n=1 Tax=Actinomadura sp. 9N215 TaxID=3375150 RepID=UPI0037A62D2F